MAVVDPRFERSVRRWLRAYPRRWRAARSDEVLGTLADLAEPGTTRLDLRAGLGLLIGGLATRVRTGPPWYQRIGYLFGARVSPRYRAWVADDLAAPVPTARVLWWVVYLGLVSLPLSWRRHDAPILAWLAVSLVWATAVDATSRSWRRDQGLRLLLPGDSGDGSRWVEGRVPRIRLSARSVSAGGVGSLVWTTVLGLVGWLVAPRPPVVRPLLAACVIAILAGAAVALVAAWRWRRWGGHGPAQPDRAIRSGRARTMLVVLGIGVLVPANVAIMTSGRHLAVAAAVLVVVGLAMLPGALAARRWSTEAPDDVAAVDLLRVAVTGRPPVRDRRVPAAVPAGSMEVSSRLVDVIRVNPDRPALG